MDEKTNENDGASKMNERIDDLFDVFELLTGQEFVKKRCVSYKSDELSGQEQIEAFLHILNGKDVPGGKDYLIVIKPIA